VDKKKEKKRKKKRSGGPAQGANKTTSTIPQENKSHIHLPIKKSNKRNERSTPGKITTIEKKGKDRFPLKAKENTTRKTQDSPQERRKRTAGGSQEKERKKLYLTPRKFTTRILNTRNIL